MQVPAAMPARGSRTTAGLRHHIKALAAKAVVGLLRWHDLARQRRALLTMSDYMLKDIGISRADAERESRRPFWSDGIGA